MLVVKATPTSGEMQTKSSINPKEISICDYKEMLMGTVNDALEILGYASAEDIEAEIFSITQGTKNN
jgi:hypothetical protein